LRGYPHQGFRSGEPHWGNGRSSRNGVERSHEPEGQFLSEHGWRIPESGIHRLHQSRTDVSLDAAFIKSLQGKEIGVVGTVKLYKGKPEIEIDDKAQIVQ
jgi:hypothetical protein